MWQIIEDCSMVWRFVALPAGKRSAYVWHWLCENERGEVVLRSTTAYAFYYECLEDARKHGYGGLTEDSGNTGGGQPLSGTAAGSRSTDAREPQKKEQTN